MASGKRPSQRLALPMLLTVYGCSDTGARVTAPDAGSGGQAGASVIDAAPDGVAPDARDSESADAGPLRCYVEDNVCQVSGAERLPESMCSGPINFPGYTTCFDDPSEPGVQARACCPTIGGFGHYDAGRGCVTREGTPTTLGCLMYADSGCGYPTAVVCLARNASGGFEYASTGTLIEPIWSAAGFWPCSIEQQEQLDAAPECP